MMQNTAAALEQKLCESWQEIINHPNLSTETEPVQDILSVAQTPCGPTTSMKVERVCRRAKEKIALVYCHLKEMTLAKPFLADLGYKYRLSDDALWHKKPTGMVSNDVMPGDGYVAAFDNAIDTNLLEKLKHTFVQQKLYWKEHQYSDGSDLKPSPYFSYLRRVPTTQDEKLDVFQQYIYQLQQVAMKRFPHVKQAKYAEFWAHQRHETIGHQFHFDSDREGEGGVRNPIVSTVLYLDNCGGPTLVTNQSIEDTKSRNEGWLVYPENNRCCVFDGKYLHGVLPGLLGNETGDKNQERTTLMVAFWEDLYGAEEILSNTSPAPKAPKACMPWPSENISTELTWHNDFMESSVEPEASASLVQIPPQILNRVWVDIEGDAVDGIDKLDRLPEYDELFQGF